MNVIVIDGGTTNTRLRVVDADTLEVKKRISLDQGVRNQAMEQDFSLLERLIDNELDTLAAQFTFRDVIGYGMLTANIGMREVPHAPSPLTMEELAAQTVHERYNARRWHWITGMKNGEEPVDVMRGEEVEAFGMLRHTPAEGSGLIILPGSHTKYIRVEDGSRLLSCTSTLAGETLSALRTSTILSDSVGPKLVEALEPEVLMEGWNLAETEGFTRAAYYVRLRHLFADYTENARANLLLGAVLYEDMKAFEHAADGAGWLYLGGHGAMQEAYRHVLEQKQERPVHVFTKHDLEKASLQGALQLANLEQTKGESR
ncbi:2-dehydro-3-deoxygalactonokinase [Marinococcus halotolerans]|uniref:2-dehydro-3-deoxygalactonokinase n=1 Tax=Marinococcus halotolerans TaxID=301092 RepID=UPI0003B64E56|nr:2-dehydro-3-deoxygalactonokinase [Marinococcus halotolerans]